MSLSTELTGVVDLLLAGLVVGSLLTLAVPLVYARRFLRRAPGREAAARDLCYPGLSVLKPVRGLDDGAEHALRTHFEQDYPGPWELIFCLESPADPALAVIEKVRAEFPGVDSRVVFSTPNPAFLGKVNNLIAGEAAARYELLLNSDSDVFFDRRDYLRQYVAPLVRDPRVGVVSCYALYCGARNLWAQLRSVRYNQASLPITAMMYELGRMNFATGSLLAFRRSVVARMGGFGAIGDKLADDAALARQALAQGYTIELCHLPARVAYFETSFRDWALHLHRWTVNHFTIAPRAFASVPLTFGLLYATLLWARHPLEPVALGFLGLAVAIRLGIAVFTNAAILGPRAEWRELAVLPLVELVVTPLSWLVVLFHHGTVSWRGIRYAITLDGTVRQLADSARK